MIKENPDIGGDKMHERFLWACKFVEDACKRNNKTLSDFEFMTIAAKLGETMFVRSELNKQSERGQ